MNLKQRIEQGMTTAADVAIVAELVASAWELNYYYGFPNDKVPVSKALDSLGFDPTPRAHGWIDLLRAIEATEKGEGDEKRA